MIPMTLQQAANHTRGSVLGQAENNALQFSAIATDTRLAMPSSLFVALKGDNFNAHEFIEQAQAQGAVACMLDEDRETSLPVLRVTNTLKAMGLLASSVRRDLSVACVGITGSCGKTTVKEMLAEILSTRGKVLATQGNFNNAIGVPLTLFRLTSDDQFAVIEMGASQAGDIDEIAQLVKPDVAVITNVSAAHLSGMGTVEGVACVKGELLNHLAEEGTAILEHDSPWINKWTGQLKTSQHYKTFSINNVKANYYASAISLNDQGQSQFVAHVPEGEIQINLPLPGAHNVTNALAAIAAATAMGATLEDCQKGLAATTAVKGRLQFIDGMGGCQIIDDSYNANPASLLVALELLKELPGKRLLVLGDMAELGEQAHAAHHQAGLQAKAMGIDGLYATGELSQLAVLSFGEGGKHFASRKLLATALKTKMLDEHWYVLVKGSRSAAMDKLVVDLQAFPQQTGTQSCS